MASATASRAGAARPIAGTAVPCPWPLAPQAAGNPAPGAAIRQIAASSGRPCRGLSMADVMAVLWTQVLKFDAADPDWADRDRIVLSGAQATPLLQAVLRLSSDAGRAGPAADAAHRHLSLADPGGPSGQALATAIGLALAERMLAARFGRSLTDHRTWVVAADQDLAGGLSHEAICLAGDLRLSRLAVLHDAGLCPVPDLAKRVQAAGWVVRIIDGNDRSGIEAGLAVALRSRRPSLICCQTRPAIDADPLDLPAPTSTETAAAWRGAGQRGAAARRAWLKRLAQHPLRAEFNRALHGRRPDEWRDALAALHANSAAAPALGTRYTSHRAMDTLLAGVPELLSCTADAHPLATAATLPHVAAHGAYRTRRIGFGPREQGMAAAMNGLALHGGWLPVGRTSAIGCDALRPALRQAAMLRRQVIHLLTQDDFGAGPAAPSASPTEHLASLRAIPDLLVFRPADAAEGAQSWELALRRLDGPSVILVSDQPAPPLPRPACDDQACSPTSRGAYVIFEPAGRRAATLIATGPEVAIALQAQAALAAAGMAVAVVSMPCWELFAQQDDAYRSRVLGHAARIGIEAACGFGWERWLGASGRFIGRRSSAAQPVEPHFSITADTVIEAVRSLEATS